MNDAWLVALFGDAGLRQDEAARAAQATLLRLLSREHRSSPSTLGANLVGLGGQTPFVSQGAKQDHQGSSGRLPKPRKPVVPGDRAMNAVRAGVQPAPIVRSLVRDPLQSVARILGRGDVGLPYHDAEINQLSVASITETLEGIGMEPVVAVAYARVFVEICDPPTFFAPLWEALGGEGPVNLEELARMDWSPLRSEQTMQVPTKSQGS